jgi:hypothetical protein
MADPGGLLYRRKTKLSQSFNNSLISALSFDTFSPRISIGSFAASASS